MADLISVIVPIYNVSAYLDMCIESILHQTYENIEIILVDDGSTDHSLQICKKYQESDIRIRIISKENGGLVTARKAGLEAAHGDYIGFVDGDDYIESDMYENLYVKIREHNVDFVHSGMIIDNQKITNYEEGIVDLGAADRADYINKNILDRQVMVFAIWSKLFRADIIREAYMEIPDEQGYGEDLLCLYRYLLKCGRFYMYKDAFYHYRVSDGSMTRQSWMDICFEESKLYGWGVKYFKSVGILEKCGDSAKAYYKRQIMQGILRDCPECINVSRYRFPSTEIIKDKKIVIYGAGNVGKDYFSQISQYNKCEIVAWVDKTADSNSDMVLIERPEVMRNREFDLVLLGVKRKTTAEGIKKELWQEGICKQDTIFWWEEPICYW